MKSKKSLWIVIVALVVLLAAAYALYQFLAPQISTDSLVSQQPEKTPSASENDTAQDDSQEDDSAGQSEPETPTQVPDFTVADGAGNSVNLSDYFGKPIVLNFWASWCGPCQSEMPHFQAAYEELGEDVQFLMVNMTTSSRETLEDAQSYLAEAGYTFPVLFDTESSAAIAYGVYSLPTTYFIDAEGYGTAYATGAIDEATLQKGIDLIYTP